MDSQKIDQNLDRMIRKYTVFVRNINKKSVKTTIGSGNEILDNLKKEEIKNLETKLTNSSCQYPT